MALPTKAQSKRIIKILAEACARSLLLKLPNQPLPYYCSLLHRYSEWFNTSASEGSTYRTHHMNSANVYCDIRVGSYTYDQTTEGGLNDNDEELSSFEHFSVPVDLKDLSGLQTAVWKLSEHKFKEAVSDFREKEADKVHRINQFSRFDSFTPLKPIEHESKAKFDMIDEEYWTKLSKSISKWMSKFPGLLSSWFEVEIARESKIFVNSEKRKIQQFSQIVSFHAYMKVLSPRGEHLQQELVLHRVRSDELPSSSQLKKMIAEKYSRLMLMIDAKKLTSYSGPAILMPQPAGLLFHEAIGHRLEGSRLLSLNEGQTFKNQEGRKILNLPITIIDDPTMVEFDNVRCVGHYLYDDEGSEAKPTVLVKDGILQTFLTTRAKVPTKDYRPNGHARSKSHQRPISRMAITSISGKDGKTFRELKNALLEEVREQDKPFGVIIYDTAGGETDTSTYDFQAFAGQIVWATLVYPDGREVPVRGVDIVGTPLQALSNIIAVGDTREIDNAYCGAESGSVPVTTISPAVLLKNLELQSKDEELVTPYLLESPLCEQ